MVKMFKKEDASLEIANVMESNLLTHAIEKKTEGLNKFAKALDYLNSVAEIFDDLGLEKEAEAATILMEVVAKKKKKPAKKSKKVKVNKKVKKTDPATKSLDSKKMVKNLEEKGWVFNADDHDDSCKCLMCDDYYPYEKEEQEQDLARVFHDLEDDEEGSDENDHFTFTEQDKVRW